MGTDKGHRPLGVGGPVIEDIQSKIGTLQRRLGWLDECIARYEKLPAHEREQKAARNRAGFDREERAALVPAIKALEYHRRELDGEARATHLLAQLVDAVREHEQARTEEQCAAARASLEEAMRHAGPYVDDMSDEEG